MSHTLRHLPGIQLLRPLSRRLATGVLAFGPPDGEPVLYLHGNLSASTFWEETMVSLPHRFRSVAPDLRGYGLSDPRARIDATLGVADWAEDVVALVDELGWDRFHLIAHSMGGCIAWAFIGGHSQRLISVTLVAPGPPCGFGGARGQRGELNHADGAGSGAGLVNPNFVSRLRSGERGISDEQFSPRAVMNRLYWKPPFLPAREEELLTAMLQVQLGEEHFPGDEIASPHWPGFAPGVHGPINAISPRYNRWVLPQFLSAPQKPRLLWVYGEEDPIVCNESLSDAGAQGKLGLRPGWPGNTIFPPQPLLRQVAYAVSQYEQTGGLVRRRCVPGVGHSPHFERPKPFQSALVDHLKR